MGVEFILNQPSIIPTTRTRSTQPRYDDDGYWDDGAGGGGYYDDAYAEGGYDEAMVTGVSPTGQIEPIGDEILVGDCLGVCVWRMAWLGRCVCMCRY